MIFKKGTGERKMRRRKLFKKIASSALALCMLGSILPNVGYVDAKAAEGDDAEWETIQSIVGRYYGEFTDPTFPGQKGDMQGNEYLGPDTALMGNGDIGVHSGGNENEKIFYISKGDFWDRSVPAKQIATGGYTIKRAELKETNPNLAPTYSKVKTSTALGGFPSLNPENVVSGKIETNANGYGWASDPYREGVGPQWFQVEFSEPITVQQYNLYSDGYVRPSEKWANTRDFEFQYSEDGEIWETADTVSGNTEDVYKKVLDTAITAKFFRVYITMPAQPEFIEVEGLARARAKIAQLELFESPVIDKPEEPNDPQLYEKQDILNAEVTTEMNMKNQPVFMRTFTSANENIVVTELISHAEEAVEMETDVWTATGSSKYPNTASVNEDNSAMVTRASSNKPVNSSYNTSKVAITSKIVGADYISENLDNATISMKFTLQPEEPVYIISAIGGGGKTYNLDGTLNTEEPEVTSSSLLKTVNSEQDIQKLLENHRSWWKDFWSASYIDFGTEDEDLNWLQKYYYGAQYILGCTSREGKAAPGINGIWVATDAPRWQNRYQLNYNFNAPFYGTSSSNRPELALPAFQEILNFMPQGMERSASIEQLKVIDEAYVNERLEKGTLTEEGIPGGLLYPAGIGPEGAVVRTDYTKEAMYAAYSAYSGIQYYEYTKDEEFLETKLYDYLKACAAFWETWLEKDENGQYNIYAGYNEGSWSLNPSVELGAVHYLFESLVDASITLSKDSGKRDTWIDIRDNLAPQPTAIYNGKEVYSLAEKERKNGEFVELTNPVPADGNALPLESLLQGQRLGYFSSPEELQIARNTIEVFGKSIWTQINNFSRVFPDAVRSRYPIDEIIDGYMSVIKENMQPNLRIKDRAHGIEKSGSTLAINEMMVLSDKGITKVFPNWLDDKDAKFANLRVKGAFLVSSEYNAALRSAEYVNIKSEKGGEFILVNPWSSDVIVRDSNGNEVKTVSGSVPMWENEKTITFDTTPGETYEIVPAGEVPEKVSLSENELNLNLGESFVLEAYTTKGSKINRWSSDNNEVVVVGKDGTITALQEGDAVVKAAVSEDIFATCKVTVSKKNTGNVAGSGNATANSTSGNYDPYKAIMGEWNEKTSTGWISEQSAANEPKWWQVKLDDTYTINRWVVYHEGGRSGNKLQNTCDFSLQISEDGENWKDVDVVKGNQENVTDRTLETPVKSQYFRIYITKADSTGSQSTQARLRRVQLYAIEETIGELKINAVENLDPISVSMGTMFDKLDLPEEVSTILSNGMYANIPVTWEKGNYQENAAGTYEITGILQLPEKIANEQDVTAKINVTVTDDGQTEKPSKTTLEYFLNLAKEHKANGDVDNCAESVKKLFEEAIAEGDAVMADEDATYDEIKNAAEKLMYAIHALNMTVDKTTLEMAVDIADGIDLANYVEEGKAEFQKALADAQAVLADENALQKQVDEAWTALVDAMENLRLKADKSVLEDLLNKVEGLDLSQYTDESVAVFNAALAKAQAVMADENLSEDDQKTVDDAVQALKDAKDQLNLKDGSGEDGNGDGNTDDEQTPGSGDNSGNSNSGNSNGKADAPKTGDTAVPFGMLGLAVLAGGAVVLTVRKRRSR